MLQQSLRRPLSRAGLGVVAAVASLALAACGGGGSGGSTSASGASGGSTGSTGSSSGGGSDVSAAKADMAKYLNPVTSYPDVAPLTGVSALKGKNVWYVPIGGSVPILSAFGTGIQQALDKAGITVHMCDGKFLPTSISSCLSQAQTQGADAVITGYVDYTLIPTAFDALVAHHIPVLIAGEAPDGGKTSSPQLAFYDTTSTIQLAQRLQMDAVIADSGGKAKVLFLGVTDSPQTKDAATYGNKYLTDHCSGCSITEIDYNTASINKVPSQVSSALISNPDTTYVVDELDAAGQGTVSGIQSAGYTNKVKLAGTNGDLDALQRIKAGNLQFVDVGVSPIYVGWQFADGILRMLAGQTPTSELGVVRVFDQSNIGSLTLTPEAYATIAWYGDDSYQQKFLSAWGIS